MNNFQGAAKNNRTPFHWLLISLMSEYFFTKFCTHVYRYLVMPLLSGERYSLRFVG